MSLLGVEQAITEMLTQIEPVTDTETLSLAALVDRVSAQTVTAHADIPGYDNSAMDGYAFASHQLPAAQQPQLEIAGISQAGHPFQGTLQAGQCIRILTGAKVPACVDTVIAQEQVTLAQDQQSITLLETPKGGANIRLQGEEVRAGDSIFTPGKRFNPVDIGLLASFGYAEIAVKRRIKVALFSTGDELMAPGLPLADGQLYDSNRYVLAAMLQRLGYEVVNLGLIKDDKEAIAATFEKASTMADAIVCSGGVSVGDFDFTKQVLDSYGSVGFWKVAMKPGKPFAFGKVNQAYFFGLPGNPVSAVVTFDQLARPALAALQGEQVTPRKRLRLRAGERLNKRPGRADFQRAWLSDDDGETKVYSTGPQGSAMLTSLANADVYICLSATQDTVERNQWVEVEVVGSPLR